MTNTTLFMFNYREGKRTAKERRSRREEEERKREEEQERRSSGIN